jgi:hypothetical protein
MDSRSIIRRPMEDDRQRKIRRFRHRNIIAIHPM